MNETNQFNVFIIVMLRIKMIIMWFKTNPCSVLHYPPLGTHSFLAVSLLWAKLRLPALWKFQLGTAGRSEQVQKVTVQHAESQAETAVASTGNPVTDPLHLSCYFSASSYKFQFTQPTDMFKRHVWLSTVWATKLQKLMAPMTCSCNALM